MKEIKLLSEETIDKIAAGEVIEKPSSVVKELVENSIDAGATSITVEIKDGGINFIRITDNGCGIPKEQIKTAFLRHATSKIETASDINTIHSLGFRGEALSSIAAVAQVEIMTKTDSDLIGSRYIIEGAKDVDFSDIGVPSGTTIIVKNLFFNTPARKKFLKSAQTEGSYVADIVEHLAMARPDIAIKFISGGQVKFQTSGRGDMKEIIYHIYGRELSSETIPINLTTKGIKLSGLLGKPSVTRSTRNFENYFVNGRYIKSSLIAQAVEEGYKEYLMQHKFPFFVLNIELDSETIDVNVHPTKMDVRFTGGEELSDYLSSAVSSTLRVNEMIPETLLIKEQQAKSLFEEYAPEPFEEKRIESIHSSEKEETPSTNTFSENIANASSEIKKVLGEALAAGSKTGSANNHNVIKASNAVIVNAGVQMELFDDRILSKEAVADYRIIGQVFDTYWLIEYQDKLLMLDQHAAHEKVKYEALIRKLNEKVIETQNIIPPIIITLSGAETGTYNQYKSHFEELGFVVEEFGGDEIALRAIPLDLYGCNAKELFLDILDELSLGMNRDVPEVINSRIATMACKSAVKGNMSMNEAELKALLDELLTLDNPYNCPHGRPTMITMSKSEMEKRFKRIV